MAYMSQGRKASLAPTIKSILKKYGVKGSLSVSNHSGLTLTLSEGKIDFGDKNPWQVNTYHIDKQWDGIAQKFLSEIVSAMNAGNHDNSDIMTDYFDVGWYVYVNIGKWNKPYKMTR
jgi:hypothetical protein